MEKDAIYLKNYPISIVFYLIYCAFWTRTLYMEYQFSNQMSRSISTGGEAVTLAMVFTAFIGAVVGFVMLALYFTRNKSAINNNFYGILAALITVQTVIILIS